MKTRAVIDIICFLLIFLFVYAAVAKLLDYNRFVAQIGQSFLVADNAVWIGWCIPTVEIGASVLLAIRRLRRIGLYVAFTLMAGFTAYIVAILSSDGHIPCACGGVLEVLGWKSHLILNMFFVVLSAAGIFLHDDEFEISLLRKLTGKM